MGTQLCFDSRKVCLCRPQRFMMMGCVTEKQREGFPLDLTLKRDAVKAPVSVSPILAEASP